MKKHGFGLSHKYTLPTGMTCKIRTRIKWHKKSATILDDDEKLLVILGSTKPGGEPVHLFFVKFYHGSLEGLKSGTVSHAYLSIFP